jgi:hypothetical protein
VTETALKRVKSFERLSFLYLLLGDTDKLGKMLKIAELRTDVLSRCVRTDQSLGPFPRPGPVTHAACMRVVFLCLAQVP